MTEYTKGPMLAYGTTVYALDETSAVNRVTMQVQGGHINRKQDGRVEESECKATAQRLADCYNALEGYNPDAVGDMVEALRDILKVKVQTHYNIWDGADRCKTIARTALTRLGDIS